MDFSLPYTPEQEEFRKEVRGWLEANVPEEMKEPVDQNHFTAEMYWWWREKHKEMATKGWLEPTYPKEYGGGGLTGDHETIIDEEFNRFGAVRRFSSTQVFPTLLVWGTEEQKQKYLRPLLTGEKVTWQKLTEPHSGADVAAYESTAVRDGDDWVLNGSNMYIGGYEDAEMMVGPMLTDPDAPRHRNLGYFVIDAPSEGLSINEMSLLGGGRKRAIFMDNVRISGDHLIGGDHQGWQVLGTHLEFEHGGGGRAFPRDEALDDLMSFVNTQKFNGSSVVKDPVTAQTAMDAYIESHVQGILAKRTHWMYQEKVEIRYEGNLANVHSRESGLRNALRVRELMGPYAFLSMEDPIAPGRGGQEVRQRAAAGQRHPGGTTNIAKVVLARRIGISRTQERPAPTPSTTSANS
jgi:hypothetical protein